MTKLAAILTVLVIACLVTAGYPAFAQGPPEQEGTGTSSTGKSDSNISEFLLYSINNRGSGGMQQGEVTRDSGNGDTKGDGKADSTGAGSTGEVDDEGSKIGDLVRFDESGNVEVYIYLKATDETALQQVRNAVARVEIENTDAGIVQAWVDPDDLNTLAALDVVREISPPDYGETRTGSINTQGDSLHRADLVRHFSGLTGKGVRVGVISDGMDRWATSRAKGDLPGSIQIDPHRRGMGHEGTALLEIIMILLPKRSWPPREAVPPWGLLSPYSGWPTMLSMAREPIS